MRYSPERKEAVLSKMIPPHNQTIRQLGQQEGISEATLYNWRQEARNKGLLMPDGDTGPERWNARDKFAAVVESASLNDLTLQRNIYVIQLGQSESFFSVRLIGGKVPTKMVSNNFHRPLYT